MDTKQIAEQALEALTALEQALDRNDQRAAGAQLHELRRLLEKLKTEAA